MRVVSIPSWTDGNPHYPLPQDYFDGNYTADGQRQARLNACRQWLLHNARADDPPATKRLLRQRKAEAYLASLRFFDSYYLMPHHDEAGDLLDDPQFYDDPPCPSPDYHAHIARASMLYRKVAAVGPRGSAKTKLCCKMIPLEMLSSPGYGILYVTSTQDLTEDIGDNTKHTIYENARIHDDWSPEYGGTVKPTRGSARQGMTSFVLTNRSWATFSSTETRKRGKRPHSIKLDDPEWDPKQSTPMEILREQFDRLLHNVLLSMIQKANTRCLYVGTFVSQQHYLWTLMQTRTVVMPDNTTREVSLDPRHGSWYRIIQPAAVDQETIDPATNAKTVTRVSCWPHMWPIDNAEKERLGLPDTTRSLEEIREELGDAVFDAEFMARPDSGLAVFFPPLTEESHGYTLSSIDSQFPIRADLSSALISFRRAGLPISHTLRDFCSRFPRFITLDTSYTNTATSDFKAALCMALTDKNELICLDAFCDRCDEDTLVQATLEMAARWRVLVVCPEGVKEGLGITQRLIDIAKTNAQSLFGVDYLPEIIPITQGLNTLSKCSKIAGLRWRFVHGLFKLPWALLDNPATAWPFLRNQIVGFRNKGGDDTGLRNDDLLDCAGLSRFVIGGLPLTRTVPDEPTVDPVSRMLRGETVDPATNTPLIDLVAPILSPDLVTALLQSRAQQASPSSTATIFSTAIPRGFA